MGMPAPVSPVYCVPYVAQFDVDYGRQGWRNVLGSDHRFSFKDAQGSLLFDVKIKSPLALHTRRVLRDHASGNVLVLLKKQIATMHKKWSAYRGDDDSDSNLLFTLSKSSYFQRTPSFDVFLSSNQTSDPDFVVKGDYTKYNYDVLSNGTPIAEARKRINTSRIRWGNDRAYGVTVNPGVDHAFIASIVTIMDQMKQGESNRRVGIGVNGGGGGGGNCGGGGGCGGG